LQLFCCTLEPAKESGDSTDVRYAIQSFNGGWLGHKLPPKFSRNSVQQKKYGRCNSCTVAPASHRLLPRSLLRFAAPKTSDVAALLHAFIAAISSQSSSRRRPSAAFDSIPRAFDSKLILLTLSYHRLPPKGATRPLATPLRAALRLPRQNCAPKNPKFYVPTENV
jgi:hypothetical protein